MSALAGTSKLNVQQRVYVDGYAHHVRLIHKYSFNVFRPGAYSAHSVLVVKVCLCQLGGNCFAVLHGHVTTW